mmetsp:Transcript_22746/g.68189  ORF Transcript_22746/g.68189 Transcript_22746/m.68189 type:complete len:408 (+) Transcript_22746:529-1752(+)
MCEMKTSTSDLSRPRNPSTSATKSRRDSATTCVTCDVQFLRRETQRYWRTAPTKRGPRRNAGPACSTTLSSNSSESTLDCIEMGSAPDASASGPPFIDSLQSARKSRNASLWCADPNGAAPGAAASLMDQAAAMGLLPAQLAGSKKQREIYVGNLCQGALTAQGIRDLFGSLAEALPGWSEARGPAVLNVQLAGQGMFAFVEMRDDTLASTMMKFHGLEVAGRPMKIGRPAGYVEPVTGAAPAMDVPSQVLRELGISGVSSTYSASHGALSQQIKKQRELYVGNLEQGVVTGNMVRELFEATLRRAAGEGSADDANPFVSTAEIQDPGNFAFVEFRDDATATAALTLLNGIDLCGRSLRVGRPQGYDTSETAAAGGTGGGMLALEDGAPRSFSEAYQSVEEPEMLGF